MGIDILSHDQAWSSQCNLLAMNRSIDTRVDVEWVKVDGSYGDGCACWLIDGERILVAQDLRAALRGTAGLGFRQLDGAPGLLAYADMYLTGTSYLVQTMIDQMGYAPADLAWVTPGLAAPPLRRPNG